MRTSESGTVGWRRWAIAVLLLTLCSSTGLRLAADQGPLDSHTDTAATQDRLRFFVVGDAPYADAEYAPLERLLSDAAAQQPAFIVHVGDIKGGSQPCTEARNRRVAQLFEQQPVPMLYTPGDNEWTDCHRQSAGGLDPLERLAAVRERFFEDADILHHQALGLSVPDPRFPENAYGLKNGVMIVLMHVVGSNNNRRPALASAMDEWQQRSRANRMLLQQATVAANTAKARAMVLFFHANPLFERSAPRAGFAPLIEDLQRLLEDYPGPVLAVHGDTHRFQFNQPFERQYQATSNSDRLWRLEVPGSPFLGGVWVAVTDDPGRPFAISVVYPRADEAIQVSLRD